MVFGVVGLSAPSSMSEFLILMPPSNRHPRYYRKHEVEKKRQYIYEQRVREVEYASFTPLVCLQLVEWPVKQPCSIRDTLHAWQHKRDQAYMQSNNVLATLPTYLLPSLVSDSVHQGCSFKLWTRGQAPNSTSGPGHLRTRFCLNLTRTYYDFEHFIYLFVCLPA